MSNKDTRVVPPRNNLPESPVDASSRGAELSGKDDDFDYMWAYDGPETRHPSHVRKLTQRRRLDDGTWVEPWQVVREETDPALQQGQRRADQGAGVDTVVRNGSMVLVRTPKSNASKKRDFEQRLIDERARGMRNRREQSGDVTVSYGVSDNPNLTPQQVAFGGMNNG